MNDLLTTVLTRARQVFAEVEAEMGRGGKNLARSEHFAARCVDLRGQLAAAMTAEPPLKPFEFKLRLTLPRREDVSIVGRLLGTGSEVDRHNRIVREVDTEVTISSGQLHWLKGKSNPQVLLTVEVYDRVMDDDRKFHWQERQETQLIEITEAILPRDPQIAQALVNLYRRREAELYQDVLAIATFTAEKAAEIASRKTQVEQLQKATEVLASQISALPRPQDATEELRRIGRQIDAARDLANKTRDEAREAVKTLAELKRQARSICPELPL